MSDQKIQQSKYQLAQLSDEELMSLYQSGNYLAFEVLYHRSSGKVFQYLNGKVSAEVAQDLLQEIFIKIHKARDQYSKQYPYLPWLFTISRNTLFDYFKSAKVSRKNSEVSLNENEMEILNLEPADLGADVNLTSALSHLPENQRRAIELRYLREWSFEKIADDIQTTPVNVRKLVSRGVKKLRSGILKIGGAN